MAKSKRYKFVSVRMSGELYDKVMAHHAVMRKQMPSVVRVPVCAAIEALLIEGFESFERKREAAEEGS